MAGLSHLSGWRLTGATNAAIQEIFNEHRLFPVLIRQTRIPLLLLVSLCISVMADLAVTGQPIPVEVMLIKLGDRLRNPALLTCLHNFFLD